MTTHVELRRGAYHDSVSLMQVSRAVAGRPGVEAAQVAMATELNVEVLRGMGFDVPAEAGPNDLVVAIRADDADGLDAGLAAVTEALAALRGTGDSGGGGDDEVAAAHPRLGRRALGRHPRPRLGARAARRRPRPSTPSPPA